MFKEKPLTGFGPDGFRKNYMLRQGDYLKEHPDSPWADLAGDTTSPFNEFFKIALEQGTIGLVFSLGVVFMIVKARRMRREQAIVAALAAFACFSYPFEFIEFQILLIICLASIANKQEPVMVFRKLRIKPAMTICAVGLFVALVFTLCSSYKYRQAVKQWDNAVIILNEKTVPELQSVYPVLKHNALFVSIYGGALHYAGYYSEAIPVLEEAMQLYPNSQTLLRLGEAYEKAGNDSGAIEAWKTAACMKPSLFAPHYNLANLYFKQLDCKQAKEEANKILTKKAKVNHPKIARMKKEMQAVLDCE
jgi:tetratricopeptide (TPR) repeat protein